MSHLRRIAIIGAVLVAVVLIASIVPAVLNPAPPSEEKRRRDSQWVSSSPYWLDRQACKFVGLCGVAHLKWDPPYVPPGSVPFEGDDDGGWRPRLELKKRSWEESPDGDVDGDDSASDSDTGLQRRRRSRAERSKYKGRQKAALRDVPSYVLEHAPLVHLFSGEHFWPADIMEHVRHLSPHYEDQPMNATASLGKLHKLNSKTGLVTLKSNDDVERRPDWLYSEIGMPVPFEPPLTEDDLADPDTTRSTPPHQRDSTWQDVGRKVPLHHISRPEETPGRRPPAHGGQPIETTSSRSSSPPPSLSSANSTFEGYSAAPAVLVMVEKAPGILDAYWFFFYSYNLGQTVARMRFGNHVGDWEHCMIRFQDGVPRAVFLSEHEGGQAFQFGAMSQYRRFPGRPVIFSAVGSHAMYALPGKHPYVLPFGMLADETDRGPLWDPAKNTYAYHYDYEADRGDSFYEVDDEDDIDDNTTDDTTDDNNTHIPGSSPESSDQTAIKSHRRTTINTSLRPAASNPDAPTSWFHYTGAWGDNLYSLADTRQWRIFMQYHYVMGPRGPKDKKLDREKMCPRFACRLRDRLDPKGKWY